MIYGPCVQRRCVKPLFLLFLVGFLSLLSTTPAAAHTGFESSDPEDGAVVSGAVSEVTLTFSGPADPAGEGFVVLDGSGELREPTEFQPNDDRTQWTLEFVPPLSEGRIGLRWTVQAPDAHPISGSLSFTVRAGASQEESLQSSAAEGSDAGRGDEQRAAEPSEPNSESRISSAVEADEDLAEFLKVVPPVYGAGALSALGRVIAFAATAMAIGGLLFASRVVRDRRPEVVVLLNVVVGSAMLVPLGAMVDFVGLLVTANGGWSGLWRTGLVDDVAYTDSGFAVYLRAVAGIGLAAAALLQLRNLPLHLSTAVGGDAAGTALGSEAGTATLDRSIDVEERTSGSRMSPPAVASAAVLVASFSFDGHTVTEGNRWLTSAADAAHVMASSIWAGGVLAFAVVLWRRRRLGQQLSGFELAVRFSVVATASLVVAAVAGVALTAVILDQPADLWTTEWGRLLLVKVGAVAVAAGIGGYNHFFVIPSLEGDGLSLDSAGAASSRLRTTVTIEAIALLAVIAVTAILVGASSQ